MLIDNRRDICTTTCTQDVEPRKPTCHCADGPVIMCDCFYPPIIDLDDLPCMPEIRGMKAQIHTHLKGRPKKPELLLVR